MVFKQRRGGFKRKSFKKNKLRKFKRGKKFSSNISPVNFKNLGYLMPNKIRMKMPFRDLTNLNATLPGDKLEILYYGNSILTPVLAGRGGTNTTDAMMFDQMMAIYRRFRVDGSKITCDFVNGTTALANSFRATVFPTRTATSQLATNGNDIVEFPYGKTVIVGTPEAKAVTRIKHYQASKRWLPSPKSDDASGDSTTVPSSQWFWYILMQPISTGVTDITAFCDVRLVYYVTFMSPGIIVGS